MEERQKHQACELSKLGFRCGAEVGTDVQVKSFSEMLRGLSTGRWEVRLWLICRC